jgi:hypothetical protein
VGDDPTVVQTYRGFWCPKEQAWLRAVVAFQDELEVAYANVVSVSVDPPEVSAAFRAGPRRALDLPVRRRAPLRRRARACARRRTRSTTRTCRPSSSWIPASPVRAAYNGYWYWGRPGMEELRADLRAVSRELRADWELAQP